VAEPEDILDDSWQKERYRYIFDSTEIPIMIINEDMKISLFNALFEAHTGYSRDDVEGKKSWAEFVVDEDLDRRRIDPGAVPNGYEFQFKDNWGNVKNAFASVSLIPGTKMNITSLFNITDAKHIEEVSVEPDGDDTIDEDRSKDIAMVLDKNVRFIFTDALLTKLIEDASLEQQERSVIAFFPRPFSENILDSITRVHEQRQSIKYDSALYMGGRNMEVEQSHLQDLALSDVNMLRNEFMTSMSHELRTPLNNIIGYTEMLLDKIYGDLNEKQSQQLVYVHSSGLILLELINDFLDLSLIEMGELSPVLELFTLDETAEDIKNICEPMANSMRHRIKLSVEPGVRVWADQLILTLTLSMIWPYFP